MPLPPTSLLPLLQSLPPHLRERVGGPAHLRPAATGTTEGPGGFVLYWMRVAVRGHENPALDAALAAARALGLPVLVYHALSERYPYASFRHHAFILQGARDAHRELQARGIPAAFHLERPGHRGPHLLTLARQARLVVTEVMPVPFLRQWSTTLAEAVAGPVWEVDASTLASVYRVPARVTDRAYRFRKEAAPLWKRWLAEPWPDEPVPASAAPPLPLRLPFDPVPVAKLDDDALARMVAQCEVDPTVGPVPHTRGGAEAGYARWTAFRDRGLARYHRDRNDPLKDGVSRMSAYLHYGHVSPFRLAREAEAQRREGSGGAEKYLDELLAWRELAWCWAHHQEDPESLSALPAWARATLEAHASDPRPALFDMETLARGRTGDALWDAAQASLRIHGELHNNVRMTWGKAIPTWTPDPETALATLIDLNHRYALDGRDPGSYGGLLWCLGAFDRPFEPPRPVLGTVRPRDTRSHARRLDVERWGEQTTRPLVPDPPSVAVVGAGIAGLTAARILQDHGLRVRVVDKGRGPGGRVATRRAREGWSMDHGAPFFTARDPVFLRQVRAWAEAGIVAPWTGRIDYLPGPGRPVEPATEATRWVGVPAMDALPRHLARDLELRSELVVAPLAPAGSRLDALAGAGRWTLERADGGTGGGDAVDLVLVTAPPAQASALLEAAHPAFARGLAARRMRPCWALMLRVVPDAGPRGADESPLRPESDALFLTDHPVLRWVARDSSKPGRDAGSAGSADREHWVLHASAAWSEDHLEEAPEAVVRPLLEAFHGLTGARYAVESVRAHRWRYSIPSEPPAGSEPPADATTRTDRCLWDPDAGIGVAGDALGGGRVEGAFLSGAALAGRVLLSLGVEPGSELGSVPQ